jgi:hypothetical protein
MRTKDGQTDRRTDGKTDRLRDRHDKANNRFSQFSERARYYGKLQQVSLNVVVDYVLANRIAEGHKK